MPIISLLNPATTPSILPSTSPPNFLKDNTHMRQRGGYRRITSKKATGFAWAIRKSLDDEFWHRLGCLGEPGGRSAEGCVQSDVAHDKQGRACNGSLDSNFEQTQRRGVGAFRLADHRCCRLSFPTSGTRSPPAAGSANKRGFSNHSRKRKPAPFFVCPPEGGACSSWIKHGFSHSLRQRLRGVTEKWFERVG
jgi:hypothetical protein